MMFQEKKKYEKQLEKMSLCKDEEFLQELQMTQISNNSLKQLI